MKRNILLPFLASLVTVFACSQTTPQVSTETSIPTLQFGETAMLPVPSPSSDPLSTQFQLGEFGAYSKAPQDSRVRWTTFVREQAEVHGFAWAYWEFGVGFGVYDPQTKVWRDDLLKALIP